MCSCNRASKIPADIGMIENWGGGHGGHGGGGHHGGGHHGGGGRGWGGSTIVYGGGYGYPYGYPYGYEWNYPRQTTTYVEVKEDDKKIEEKVNNALKTKLTGVEEAKKAESSYNFNNAVVIGAIAFLILIIVILLIQRNK